MDGADAPAGFGFLNRVFELIARRVVPRGAPVVDARRRFGALDDEALRDLARRALAGELVEPPVPREGAWHELRSLLYSAVPALRRNPESVPLLGLAAECFRRAPADLAPGSQLYPEQIRAANALTQRCVVEMATGEGKTYAILPAAFTLACQRHRVYVVCPSEYLAWRDANRTRGFWRFIGLEPGLCISSTPPAEWDRRVVYTTLEQLAFAVLRQEIAAVRTPHPVTFGAVIADDVDAIFLDQTAQRYVLVQLLEGGAFNWSFALDYAQKLEPDIDVSVSSADLRASLTVSGESRLRREIRPWGWRPSRVLLTRYAIELAYVATRVVQRDEHYVLQSGRVYPVDLNTGRVLHGVTPDWVPPLEASLGLPPRPKTIELHSLSAIHVLNAFKHLSGTSGTIAIDALEFLLDYTLLRVSIPPRFPRAGAVEPDLVYGSRAGAQRAAAERVDAAVAEGRPVLVGAQTIVDAEAMYALLRERLPEHVRLALLTGKDDRDLAQTLEGGGEVGSVIVATQLAGRGVDIRLSDEARAHGGMCLVCLGHATEPRHDRQFLGRAGRHGDPFTAVFICSLDDALFQRASPRGVQGLVGYVKQEYEHDPIPVFRRAIRNAQSNLRYLNFLARQQTKLLGAVQAEVTAEMRPWFQYLQAPVEGEPDLELAPEFLRRVVEHYLDFDFGALLAGGELDAGAALKVVETLAETLDLAPEACPVQALDVEGLRAAAARSLLAERLQATLDSELERAGDAIRASRDDALLAQRVAELANTCDAYARALQAPDPWPPGMSAGDLAWHATPLGGLPESLRPLAARAAVDVAAATELLERSRPEGDGAPELPEHEAAALASRLGVASRGLLDGGAPFHRSGRIGRRPPRAIAHWSLQQGWIEFHDQCERLIHQVMQGERSRLGFHRVVSDRITVEWKRSEAAIARSVLANLLRASRPGELDDLFVFVDRSTVDAPAPVQPRLEWSATGAPAGSPGRAETGESFVDQFINRKRSQISPATISAASLRQLLREFLVKNPLHTLQSPERILAALDDWGSLEALRGVSRKVRQGHRRWLWRFLEFLHDRRSTGPLPAMRHRVKSRLQLTARSLSEVRTSLSLLAATVAVSALIGLVRFGDLIAPPELGAFGGYVDALLFGGLVASGNLLAPALGTIVAADALQFLISGRRLDVRGRAFDRFALPVFQVAVAAWLLWGAPASVGDATWRGTLFVAMFGLATLMRWVAWTLVNVTQLDLTLAWLSYCIAFPFLAMARPPELPEPLLLGGLAGFAALWWAASGVRGTDVALLTTRISGTTPEGEEMEVGVRVDGSAGVVPHIFALLLCLTGYELLQPLLEGRAGVSGATVRHGTSGVYVLIVLGWSAAVLRRRFALGAWREQLNRQRQVMPGARDSESLRVRLDALRRGLVLREAAFLALFAAVPCALLAPYTLPGSAFPLAPVGVAATAVFAAASSSVARELYELVFKRTAASAPALDLSRVIPEPEEESLAERVRRLLERRLPLVLAALIIIVQVIELLVSSVSIFQGLF